MGLACVQPYRRGWRIDLALGEHPHWLEDIRNDPVKPHPNVVWLRTHVADVSNVNLIGRHRSHVRAGDLEVPHIPQDMNTERERFIFSKRGKNACLTVDLLGAGTRVVYFELAVPSRPQQHGTPQRAFLNLLKLNYAE